jgi:hypothetical protein
MSARSGFCTRQRRRRPSTTNRRKMALPPISRMPFLATACPTSPVLPYWPDVIGRPFSPTTETAPARPRIAQTKPCQPMPYPFRICAPRQIIYKIPTPCRLYSSFECHEKSPLRVVMFQDQIEPPQPVWRAFQRRRNLNRFSAREALSDASGWSSQVSLLPRRRSFVSSAAPPRRASAAEGQGQAAARSSPTTSARDDT